MSKQKVYILQDTKEACEDLAKNFSASEEFIVVGKQTVGEKAVEEVKEMLPDRLITDLVISRCDGLYVISKVKEANKDIKIIVLSSLCSEEIVSKTIEVGADYFLAKPMRFEILKDRILEINSRAKFFQTKEEKKGGISLEEKISNIFINVGIPPHIKGYSFLREGVKMAVADPDIMNNITKKLYPKIGEKYQTTASKVERAIRHAIEVAWNRGRIESINTLLGVRAYVGSEKPTNGEFIALVADKMLLEKA